jgi:GNAT superfamily N-acetyltransferase
VIEFRDVDKHDEVELRAWYDTWAGSMTHRPSAFVESWANARVALPRDRSDYAITLITAYDDGEPVGAGLVNLPMNDHVNLAFTEVATLPDRRRRGIGRLILEETERRAVAADRERCLVEVYVPAEEDAKAWSGVTFAESRGYSCANREGMKALDLAASEPAWAALEQECAAAAGGYRVVGYRDVVADEHLDGFCAMLRQFMSLVPQGDLGLEQEEWTPERLREAELRRTEIGTATFGALALSPDGEVVGGTEARVGTHDPRVAHIGITVVLPGHRGHRLGLAMKLASHRALRAAFPQCELVATSNSEVNDHMNAINERLGYRQLETLLEYHRTL